MAMHLPCSEVSSMVTMICLFAMEMKGRLGAGVSLLYADSMLMYHQPTQSVI